MQIQKEKHALGACSRGRAFLFGFIRRQPYMKQALQCLRMGMAQFHGVLYSALCFRYCTGVMSYAFLNRRLKCSTFS